MFLAFRPKELGRSLLRMNPHQPFTNPLNQRIVKHIAPFIPMRHFSADDPCILQFPNKYKIMAYLKNHPLTNDHYLTEKKIIETIAKSFANKKKIELGLEIDVLLSLYEHNETLKLPEFALNLLQANFVAALKDCAKKGD